MIDKSVFTKDKTSALTVVSQTNANQSYFQTTILFRIYHFATLSSQLMNVYSENRCYVNLSKFSQLLFNKGKL